MCLGNKVPVMKRITGIFYVLPFEDLGKDPDNYCDYKNHNKYSDSHSGFKNVSN